MLSNKVRPDVEVPHTAVRVTASESRFRAMAASRIGARHVDLGEVREDSFDVSAGRQEDRPWSCVIVADGVGSAPLAWLGSHTAASVFGRAIRARLAAGITVESSCGLVLEAARDALEAIDAAAFAREVPPSTMGTTLLCAVAVERADGALEACVFQAGNGLVAQIDVVDGVGKLTTIFDPGDEEEDGAIHALHSRRVREGLAAHASHFVFDPPPSAIVLLTDGVSDDMIPLLKNGPILWRALSEVPDSGDVAAALLDVISYKKPGSGDDRTLGVILGRRPTATVVKPPPEPTEFEPTPLLAAGVVKSPPESPEFESTPPLAASVVEPSPDLIALESSQPPATAAVEPSPELIEPESSQPSATAAVEPPTELPELGPLTPSVPAVAETSHEG